MSMEQETAGNGREAIHEVGGHGTGSTGGHVGGSETGKLGMWLFISTEILLFGGLFLLYAMYRLKNPADFHAASLDLSRFAGTLNTCVLITSSLTVVLAVFSLQRDRARDAVRYLAVSIALGFVFLVVKGFEWAAKFEHGLNPNAPFLATQPKGVMLYFGLYFTMTGLHAVHVIVGMTILGIFLVRIRQGKITARNPTLLENAGLYWHLVDVIWIFLFPLFYLIS
jgi:cytochrome c oxidase subunit III